MEPLICPRCGIEYFDLAITIDEVWLTCRNCGHHIFIVCKRIIDERAQGEE